MGEANRAGEAPESGKVVSASLDISAPADRIFELIAEPAEQPRWDGNDNLAEAAVGQRVHGVGDVFRTSILQGGIRDNHVVEFEEGALIAWRPSEPGSPPPGHLWRWELSPLDDVRTRVTHTYDWSRLTDEKRMVRARATGVDALLSSLTRLARIAEDI
ncbi:SRPBCC family protein [Mycolicibacterium hodleri]|uniref:Polyketide cyclase n=1 Tax=Mycolicibacterium hodleri TaxID=49897 RepID=A0A502E457_9MYCO|nr:SRPBCC family protein [Mycolicibacterium hodleri]TPG31562.1 polyketide cyclase [Mycolicibacterium hodleri]